MKKNMLVLVIGLMICGLYACNKNPGFDPQGGELPTHYITFRDSSFSPSILTVASGSSITFLNQTNTAFTLAGDDSIFLKPVVIDANSFYFFKPDTATATPVQIYIPYHNVERPAARGTIILNP